MPEVTLRKYTAVLMMRVFSIEDGFHGLMVLVNPVRSLTSFILGVKAVVIFKALRHLKPLQYSVGGVEDCLRIGQQTHLFHL